MHRNRKQGHRTRERCQRLKSFFLDGRQYYYKLTHTTRCRRPVWIAIIYRNEHGMGMPVEQQSGKNAIAALQHAQFELVRRPH